MTAPSWMKPEGTSGVRAAQIDRDWERRAMRSLPRSGRDAQRLGPEGIERGDEPKARQAPIPANDPGMSFADYTERYGNAAPVCWLIDKLWEDQLTPSDKGDEG